MLCCATGKCKKLTFYFTSYRYEYKTNLSVQRVHALYILPRSTFGKMHMCCIPWLPF